MSQRWVFGLVAVAILASPLAAASLTFAQIDVPGALGTVAFGINDGGKIVGAYADAASPECVAMLIRCHGFLLENGVFTQIDFPGATTTLAQGINDSGEIVGQFLDAAGVNRGFLLKKDVFTQIDVPGALVTGVNAINDRGQIVGIFDDGPDPAHSRHRFLLEGGVFTQIDFPGSEATSHVGMNDSGQIVGVFFDAGIVAYGFFLDGGIYTQLDFPGALDTSSEGISDNGQIVGQFFVDRPGLPRGFLLDEGLFTPIDAPGAIYTIADAGGTIHGFLATPVPEPSTLVLLSIGALGLLSRLRRRKK